MFWSQDPKNNDLKTPLIFFGKEQTAILGGIAILLMIWHHLFNSPSWYSEDVFVILPSLKLFRALILIPAAVGNICVQIFAIISGYALYINTNSYGNWKIRGLRLLKFLGAYWFIFALFLLVAWFNNDSLPSLTQFFHNLVGVETGPNRTGVNIPFAWYVAFYIQFIFLTPLLLWIFQKDSIKQDFIGFLFLCGMVYFLPKIPYNGFIKAFISNIHPLLCVGLGILAAKHKIFDSLHQKILRKCPGIFIFMCIALVFYIKYKLPQLNQLGGNNWSFFMTICFSFLAFLLVSLFLELINRIKYKILQRFLIFLGTISMYLWFIHGIFFTGKNFLQKELYNSHEPIVIYILCLTICIPVAYIIHKFYTFLWTKLTSKLPFASLRST